VKTAHAKGIKLRYWDQPGWPISTRNSIVSTIFVYLELWEGFGVANEATGVLAFVFDVFFERK
jgi:hypothetical protein